MAVASEGEHQILEALSGMREEFVARVDRLDEKIDRQGEKIDRVSEKVDTQVSGLRTEIASVRNTTNGNARKIARLEGQAEGREEAFGPNGTGRFQVPRAASVPDVGATPAHGSFVVPTPAAGQSLELRVGEKRSSIPPPLSWIVKLVKKMLGKNGLGLIIAGALGGGAGGHALLSKWLSPSPVTGAASTPATSSPPVVPLPFDPPTRPSTPAAIDAGTKH